MSRDYSLPPISGIPFPSLPERFTGSDSRAVLDTVLIVIPYGSLNPSSVLVVFQTRYDVGGEPLMCRVTPSVDSHGTQTYELHWMPEGEEPVDGGILQYAAVRATVGFFAGEHLGPGSDDA